MKKNTVWPFVVMMLAVGCAITPAVKRPIKLCDNGTLPLKAWDGQPVCPEPSPGPVASLNGGGEGLVATPDDNPGPVAMSAEPDPCTVCQRELRPVDDDGITMKEVFTACRRAHPAECRSVTTPAKEAEADLPDLSLAVGCRQCKVIGIFYKYADNKWGPVPLRFIGPFPDYAPQDPPVMFWGLASGDYCVGVEMGGVKYKKLVNLGKEVRVFFPYPEAEYKGTATDGRKLQDCPMIVR